MLSTGNIFLVFGVTLLQLIASVWSLVIYINALAEVHEFSSLKAILNIIIASVLILVVFLVVFSICRWTCGNFFREPVLVMLGKII
jgi:hypothetical protein